ncbi:amino-acid N-acetyltransferase [Moraxella caviae]|uniref:Amino-acid acetyltransferase n=1 Tax=Moraxella caviae TaxID=34060 RepID=A0A1T0ABY0_9GAMM|nr:amino-acid N-acetyltransferase [Moraxella caviae]OOR93159.1 amino-acid N-acetyltransferase [Moraxella caviae]STZ10427.1 Amino-acid acetyltransferase [Moraxella caviae]VEW10593.1 Amino-acid acetyltransferase [Moraxella caviae]
MTHPNPIHWFRHSAPYINTHRGKIFVIMFGGEAVAHANFESLIHDFALLHSLGIRLVLVHGARPQIDAALRTAGIDTAPMATHGTQHVRVTPTAAMPHILAAVGAIRLQIEAHLSTGLANSPMFGSRISVVSGNFITAKPYGIHDGIDYQMTGQVRRVDAAAMRHNLERGHIITLGTMGVSATGEAFNLLAEDVALQAAIALQADKLILLGGSELNDTGTLIRELTTDSANQLLQRTPAALTDELARFVRTAIKASTHVERTHLLPYTKDGALITELFTLDGAGTMITKTAFDQIRPATTDDVVGLLALLKPLQEQGILIWRSQARLEEDIEHYSVIERDGAIIGCVALHPLDSTAAELASLAIHPAYRSGSRGEDLLRFVQMRAKQLGVSRLFALTTHTAHWFLEHGFAEVDFTALPDTRQERYHNGRKSKVLLKYL